MTTNPVPSAIVWSRRYLEYAWTPHHPMSPVRLELTMALAAELGVLDGIEPIAPRPAGEDELLRIHTPEYVAAVERAGAPAGPAVPLADPADLTGYGLGTEDDPVFEGMHDAAAVIVGGTLAAVREVASGRARRAVSIGGGMHHAMPGTAAGFCIYNDVAVAISWLLDHGFDRIAYVDVDVHHGDGVQRAFVDDPRVLTVSVHQDPTTLWPGTGRSSEIGDGAGRGTVVNLPLPPRTADAAWLRAFHAVVPAAVAAFRPQILISQCGVDTHWEDPLGELSLTVDGQRAAFLALRDLADAHAGGRWVAVGGGGYDVVRVVPRAWTHLLAIVLGREIDPATPLPAGWRAAAARFADESELPATMGDGGVTAHRPWPEPPADRVDEAILATRRAAFPLLGLDPDDPRG